MWSRSRARPRRAPASLAACRAQPSEPRFPAAHRDVAPIVGDTFSTEDARDRLGEAEQVMQLAGVKPGMSVADVGAGEGYYTVRLARVVGPKGRVLAEDIVPEVRDALSERVQREKLDNVAVKLGTPDDPMLPPQSFDRMFLVHMYHEVQSPYAFLWHLREGREARRPRGRGRCRPAGEAARNPARAAEVRVRRARPGAGEVQRAEPAARPISWRSGWRRPRPAPEQIKPCEDPRGSRAARRLVHSSPPNTR